MTVGSAKGNAERTGVMAGRTSERIAPDTDATDDALVEGARRGDDRSFAVLFERYHRRILTYVDGLIGDRGRAEDITQEVFISGLARIRVTESHIEFRGWIYQIARNACIDEFRRTSRKREVSLDAGDATLDAAERSRFAAVDLSPAAAADQRQTLRDLLSAFDGLSDTNHRALVLRELGGLSYQEIGEEMGISQSAVESTLFRARRRLGKDYEDLASGETCARIELMTGAAARGRLGSRDQRQFARHVAHCSSCRVRARLAGVEESLIARHRRRRRAVRETLAGLLPIPASIRDRLPGGARATSGSGGGPGQAFLSHWPSLAPVAEPLAAGWGTAAIVATAVAASAIGGGVGVRALRDDPKAAERAPAAVAPLDSGAAQSSAGPPAGRSIATDPSAGGGNRQPSAAGSPGAARSSAARQGGPDTAARPGGGSQDPLVRAGQPGPGPSTRPGGGAGRSPVVTDPGVMPPERPGARVPTPRVPKGPQVKAPEVPKTPKTPKIPKAPEVPEVPGTPKASEPPKVADPPEVPKVPNPQDLPQAPTVPALPDPPRVPAPPEAPSLPVVP